MGTGQAPASRSLQTTRTTRTTRTTGATATAQRPQSLGRQPHDPVRDLYLLPGSNFCRNQISDGQSHQVGGDGLAHLEEVCVGTFLLPGISTHHSGEAIWHLTTEKASC